MSVSQPRSGRVWLEADLVEKYGQVDMSLGLWSECENVNDHVTAYDGPGLPGTAPHSPLIVFCHGGVVPQIVSSGPDMLVVFRTSPFSVPKVSPYSLTQFELKVDIKFVDIESESYVPRRRKLSLCRLMATLLLWTFAWIKKTSPNRAGVAEPKYTLRECNCIQKSQICAQRKPP